MLKKSNSILYILLFLNCLLGSSNAQTPCAGAPSGNILASASTWDNLRNNENSIKFNINTLIKSATEGKKQAVFTIISKPNKFLSDYSDKEYCEKKKQETLSNKLVFTSPELTSTDDLNSWIGDFSQGKGDAGGDLYSKCDKTCSPSYEYEITYSTNLNMKAGTNNRYKVKALVVCGEARDKDDNQYSLTLVCKD